MNEEDLKSVKTEEADALTNDAAMWDGMIKDSTKVYEDQKKASEDWVKTQTNLQNEKTEFAIDEINQQKEQTRKDYLKEQSGAYVDWQKQSNQYGANAEKMAATGLTNTGYSESSQVSMYNQYQNRVAMARESYNRAALNFDNAIREAKLQNSSILAEIAYQGLQEQLKYTLEGMQYKNTLLIGKTDSARQIRNEYLAKWKTVLDQINTEKAQAEQKRQFNENMAFQREQFNWQKEQANKSSGGSSSINKSSSSSSGSGKKTIKDIIKDTLDKVKKTSKKDDTKELEVDMDSVLALGYGPISAAKLDELVESGQVIEYEENGKLKYKEGYKIPDMTAGGRL